MKVNIISQQYNPLLKRKEVKFEIIHEDVKGTPTRLDVRKALSDALKAKVELVYVKKMETRTGTMQAKGEANIYDTVEQAKLVEPEHIIVRNVPSEKKVKDEEKAEAAPPQPPVAEKKEEKKEEPKQEKKEK